MSLDKEKADTETEEKVDDEMSNHEASENQTDETMEGETFENQIDEMMEGESSENRTDEAIDDEVSQNRTLSVPSTADGNSCNDTEPDDNKDELNTEQLSENDLPPTSDNTEKGSKDSSDSNLVTDNDSQSSTTNSRRSSNVARRGRKRKYQDLPQRETPRRAARKVKTYNDEDAFNDEEEADDPDFKFSDSDDDPDFDPSNRRDASSPDLDIRPRRSKKGRNDFTPTGTGTTTGPNTTLENVDNSSLSPGKRRGRPPSYASSANQEISDNTVSSTDDRKSPGNLSSAYNYSISRTRQNQAIRLPEGPNLTDDQLKLIESQFKSGDFVMAKKDTDMMENPPIWRIDGKSLLQKFQAFEKDGKFLYRNISTYSGWTAQAKALYIPVKVKFVFQSRYDTVVELLGFKTEDPENAQSSQVIDKPVWLPTNKDLEKITDELRVFMPSFEIYLQTLISQALDNNFLQEIYEEKDAYFVDHVTRIDDLTEDRKQSILKMTNWDEKFLTSLDKWPCVNTMASKNTSKCQACGEHDATMLSQFYGQPYDKQTLRFKEPTSADFDNKNFETCDSCSTLSQLFNKVTHQKYDYYSQCKSTVTNMRVSQANKTTTNVLRDLLANDIWIAGLFRSMCTTWIKIDKLFEAENKSEETTKIPNIDIPTASERNQSTPTLSEERNNSSPIGAEESRATKTNSPEANQSTPPDNTTTSDENQLASDSIKTEA